MPSARFTNAALAQESAEQLVFLVTIEHAAFPETLRWCTGGADITSNGNLFEARASKVIPPGDSAETGGRRGRIMLDNTTPDAIGMLRLATSRPAVTIEAVLAAYPDDVEFSWPYLEITGQRPNAQAIELDVAERDDSNETFPYQAFTPRRFRGLFD